MIDLNRHWLLEPGLDFLNHGSFGACPMAVLDEQNWLRRQLERQPVDFLVRRMPDLFDQARARLADFVGADPEGLVAVPNATTGVNTVLRSLDLEPGDELLTTDHAYNACRNALDFVAERSGARVVTATVPFPIASPDEITSTMLDLATERTRLALIDHVTSPTALVLPIEQLVSALDERGIDTLIDGAHAPGMVDLDVTRLGCTYYTGNCHKWMCSPKGAAFLYVDATRRQAIRPLVISHGANVRRAGRSHFHDEFDWLGTVDPTAFLCVPHAIDVMAGMVDGGWPEIRRCNHRLAVDARSLLLQSLGQEAPCPDTMLGSIATVILPGSIPPDASPSSDPLVEQLLEEFRIEVMVSRWPALGQRLLRISAQLYNRLDQYRRLAEALAKLEPAPQPVS